MQIRCIAHVVNLVSQDILHLLGEVDDPNVIDYFDLHWDLPYHYDPSTDKKQKELETEVAQENDGVGLEEESKIDEDVIKSLKNKSPLERV
ncbi:hypothetical protein VKT23_003045 [Stygiomarasmius scandens]|uniref:Transposase n=1 Tax=Marasmiellus scandens TaxID=2682957 RepID=A0ABR1JWS3_9AGAR